MLVKPPLSAKTSATNTAAGRRVYFMRPLAAIRDATMWTAVRVPSPIYVAMLSRTPAAIGGTIALLVLAIFLLFNPSGILGVLFSALAWAGGLALGATAVRASLLAKQLVDLEEKLRVSEMELNKRLSADERSVLRKARAPVAVDADQRRSMSGNASLIANIRK